MAIDGDKPGSDPPTIPQTNPPIDAMVTVKKYAI
jgi:hypothetical protein